MANYPASVENAMLMSSMNPNYNPAEVMRSVGQLSLQKKRWREQVETGKEQWGKEFGLKERDIDLRERAFQAEIDKVNRQLEEAVRDASFRRGFGVLQMGAGTPEERAQFFGEFGMPFSEEGKINIPGYGYAYGQDAMSLMRSGGGGGGFPGANVMGGRFDPMSAMKELQMINRTAPSYAFSARSPLGTEAQIYHSLQDRARKLANQLSRASVPGF
jgi:hypothetical protein